MYRRTAWIEGYLDEHPGSLLPAGANNLLDFTQGCRLKSIAVPHSRHTYARRLRGVAVARLTRTRYSRGMAGSSTLGIASGTGAIGCVGNGIKKYAVVLVLPFVDLLFFEDGRGGTGQSRALVATCWGASVFYHGDCEQSLR